MGFLLQNPDLSLLAQSVHDKEFRRENGKHNDRTNASINRKECGCTFVSLEFHQTAILHRYLSCSNPDFPFLEQKVLSD